MTEETTERSLTTYDICSDTVDTLARDGEQLLLEPVALDIRGWSVPELLKLPLLLL